MLPLVIMAAASILSNKQKQDQARRETYLQTMEHQAQRLGGNADLAEVYDRGMQIDNMSADYGPLLKASIARSAPPRKASKYDDADEEDDPLIELLRPQRY